MGYCEASCKYLTTRHNCKKYGKRLGYSKVTVCGNVFSASHERCSECEKDHRIAELEVRLKSNNRPSPTDPEEGIRCGGSWNSKSRRRIDKHPVTEKKIWSKCFVG